MQKYFQRLKNDLRVVCLRIALQSGNEEQFDWLIKRIKELPEKDVGDKYGFIVNPFSRRDEEDMYSTKYNLLFDAYVGGNLKLVEKLEALVDFSRGEQLDCIIQGYHAHCLIRL